MVNMTALARQNYGGRAYIYGDDMDVNNERDAADLICLGLAQRRKPKGDPIAAEHSGQVETRESKAEDEPPAPASVQLQKTQHSKDRYSRRDMRASR